MTSKSQVAVLLLTLPVQRSVSPAALVPSPFTSAQKVAVPLAYPDAVAVTVSPSGTADG